MEKSIKFIKTWQERTGYFEYSVKLRQRKRKNKIIFGLRLNVFLKSLWSVFRFPIGFYGVKYLEIPITTACTLRCRDCANLMQYYRSDYNCSKTHVGSVDCNKLMQAMNNLLKCVDYIEELHILGGEPFLNKDLPKILRFIKRIKKVKNITIVTNGTLVPSQEILEILQENRCEIFISNYGEYSSKINEIVRLCADLKIRCKVLNNSQWYQSGGLNLRERSVDELEQQYSKCGEFCRSLLNGQLYICPRSAHGSDLGVVNDWHVNLLEMTSPKEKQKELLELEDLNYIMMCNYCNEGTDEYVPIPRGVQVSKND